MSVNEFGEKPRVVNKGIALNKSKLARLAHNLKRARNDMTDYLNMVYPVGARVQVKLRFGQVNLTPATVVRVHPTQYGGEIGVRIDNAKQFSRQQVRDIPVDDVYPLTSEQQK